MSGLFKSTVIPGNKLTDFAATTAQVGIPIPFGYGEYVVSGNILWAHLPPKENVTRRRQGKGGVKTETYTYTLSYAISFGLGPIFGYKWIERQGKIVYTTDPTAPLEDREYAQKWLQRATIHLGGAGQLPDSTIEAVEGSGQVSAFKHLTYIVLEEEDVTENGGAPPNYRACCVRGSGKSYTTPPYPYLDKSELAVSAQARNGSVITWVPPQDRMNTASEAEDGGHRVVLLKYGYAESTDHSSVAVNGEHKSILLGYGYGPEEVNNTAVAVDGGQRLVKLQYQIPHEDTNASSVAVNGGHGIE